MHTSKDLGQYSPSKQSLKLRLKDAEQRDSAQKFSKILSLYDKSVADQLGRTDSKPLVPKFNLKSKEALTDPLDALGKKPSMGYAKTTYLTRVKEILTSRKATGKGVPLDDQRSPRSTKQLALFSSMHEDDLLKIYDMKSLEPSGLHLAADDFRPRFKTRASEQGVSALHSPHNHTCFSGPEADEYSLHHTHELLESDTGQRYSLGSPDLGLDFADPRLAALVDRVRQTLATKDDTIEHLRADNERLRGELEAVRRDRDGLLGQVAQTRLVPGSMR